MIALLDVNVLIALVTSAIVAARMRNRFVEKWRLLNVTLNISKTRNFQYSLRSIFVLMVICATFFFLARNDVVDPYSARALALVVFPLGFYLYFYICKLRFNIFIIFIMFVIYLSVCLSFPVRIQTMWPGATVVHCFVVWTCEWFALMLVTRFFECMGAATRAHIERAENERRRRQN